MNIQACFQTAYLQLLAADAAQISRRADARAARDFAEYRQQGLDGFVQKKHGDLIMAMLMAVSFTAPADTQTIADRVVGLSEDNARKSIKILEKRGLVKAAGFHTADSGRARKLWLRVAS